jgi:outer membrane protein assembly factor BamC
MKLTSRPALPPTRIALSVALALTLAGCSTSNGVGDGPRYQASRQMDTLEVPPDLIGPEMERAYRIPDAPGERISARDLEEEMSSAPRRATGASPVILPGSPDVQLQRDGQTRWLSVAASPEALWPRLREFWRTQNLILERDEPTIGVMETQWAENRAGIPLGTVRSILARTIGTLYDAGTRDQYRLRVERRDDGGTDVFITHRGAVEEVDSEGTPTRWVIRDSDPSLEAEMLNRLLVFLTTGEVSGTAVTAEEADDFEQTGQVDLVERDGQPTLVIRGEPDALWRRLGLALDRTGFLVDEQDRSTGSFLVTYRPDIADGAEEPGFFSRLFGGRGASSREDERYQVRMRAGGEDGRDLQIIALTLDGQPLSTRDARFILEQIQPQLR